MSRWVAGIYQDLGGVMNEEDRGPIGDDPSATLGIFSTFHEMILSGSV